MKEKLENYIKNLLEINEKYKEQFNIDDEYSEWYSLKWLEDTCNEILAIINSGEDK